MFNALVHNAAVKKLHQGVVLTKRLVQVRLGHSKAVPLLLLTLSYLFMLK